MSGLDSTYPSITLPEPTKVPNAVSAISFSKNSATHSTKDNLNGTTSNTGPYTIEMARQQRFFGGRRNFIEAEIKKKFPLKFMIINCLVLIILTLLAFTFQALQFVYKYQLYYVGAGFW